MISTSLSSKMLMESTCYILGMESKNKSWHQSRSRKMWCNMWCLCKNDGVSISTKISQVILIGGGVAIGVDSCVGVVVRPASPDLGCLSAHRGLIVCGYRPLTSSANRYGLPWTLNHEMYFGEIMDLRVGKSSYILFQMLIFCSRNQGQSQRGWQGPQAPLK